MLKLTITKIKMMKNLLKGSIPALAFLALFSACTDDDAVVDTTAPILNASTHSEVVEPGGEFDLELALEDDLALGEVRVDIHDDFDGHDHEGGRLNAEPFEYTNVFNAMQGKKTFTLHEHIDIPANAATGPYHITITYFDNAGNEGEIYIGTFEISDPAQSPSITITNFADGAELEPNAEGMLLLEGTVEDVDGLEEVHIMVTEGHEESAGARMMEEVILYEGEWLLNGATTFDMQNIQPAIDLSAVPAGHYELRILARDIQGNAKVVWREVHID